MLAAEVKLRSPWLLLRCCLSRLRQGKLRAESLRDGLQRATSMLACVRANTTSSVCAWGAEKELSVCPALSCRARASLQLQLLCAVCRSVAPRLAQLGRSRPPRAYSACGDTVTAFPRAARGLGPAGVGVHPVMLAREQAVVLLRVLQVREDRATHETVCFPVLTSLLRRPWQQDYEMKMWLTR